MGLIKPKKLKLGDTIGVIAPGGRVKKENVDAASENLRQAGFNVVVHKQVYETDGVAAGTMLQRLQGLHDMFAAPEIDAIFAATGGLRSMQLLDKIDYDLIRQNPKIFCGFSDVTYVLSALHHRAGLVTFHGCNLRGFMNDVPIMDREKTLSFFMGHATELLAAESAAETIKAGEATGRLIGGNMCLLNSLMAMGDRYIAPFKNALLMIEDVGEEMRSIDRLLSTLRLAGVFDHINGLIIGHMTDIGDNGTHYRFNCSVRDIITEHCKDMGVPVIYGAPFGHEQPNLPFPIGVHARLLAPEKAQPQLQLLESPFSEA